MVVSPKPKTESYVVSFMGPDDQSEAMHNHWNFYISQLWGLNFSREVWPKTSQSALKRRKIVVISGALKTHELLFEAKVRLFSWFVQIAFFKLIFWKVQVSFNN